MALGGFLLAFALLIFLVLLGKEDAGSRFFVPLFCALGGGGAIAATATSLLASPGPGEARGSTPLTIGDLP